MYVIKLLFIGTYVIFLNYVCICSIWMDGVQKQAAIYTRVSTEDQAKEGFSLDAQLDKLRLYCHARQWDIFNEFIDDGYSGRTIKRPGYSQLMHSIDSWDILLVIKMDRIHRNSKHFMLMMEELQRQNKEFVSMTESLDTSTAMGRFVMDIIQRIAQLESEQIGERVYSGMQQKAKTNGGPLGFNIPYGYYYDDGLLYPDPEEAKIVERIFQMYLSGNSMKQIAFQLNKEHIPTKQKRVWGSETVSKILKNKRYCGYMHWEEYEFQGAHEPIIDEKVFSSVQHMITTKRLGKKNTSIK